MSQPTPSIYLVRHGETAWTKSRQHTGLTDLPLTDVGEKNAEHLGERLRPLKVAHIFTSPLHRARRTCDLAGFGTGAINEPDLVEWDYGKYEGLTTAQIHEKQPKWKLFEAGCPGGESPAQVGARADRVIARLRALDADAIVFSSGHIMRVLAARWLGLEPAAGRLFALGTTTLSILGYEHDKSEPVIKLWNDARPEMDG